MGESPLIALKVDVDTDRGTREGVPALVSLFKEFSVPACFLFSLGPDNTGKAISRIFRPGFFSKVSRTSVVSTYGIRTLLCGTLLPAPHIGRRHADLLRSVRDDGFESGIHSYDHYHWQDHLFRMSLEQVREEFQKARDEYQRIFGEQARTAGAAGWQAGAHSKQVYDEAGLLYASDSRGSSPFFPRVEGRRFETLEIPTTLPTLDELLGRPEYPEESLPQHYGSLLSPDRLNVFTLHAEIEGMAKIDLFRDMLLHWKDTGCSFVRMDEQAEQLLSDRPSLPEKEMLLAEIDGRSGNVAVEGPRVV
jgi:undecaprenyl phosphate-alpha-L-ara4FN deformylase